VTSYAGAAESAAPIEKAIMKTTRRDFLKTSAAAGLAGVALPQATALFKSALPANAVADFSLRVQAHAMALSSVVERLISRLEKLSAESHRLPPVGFGR
jgi:hypothetical protein